METKELYQRYFGFPEGLTYEDFLQIPDRTIREKIITNNRILQTDTYNRTMEHVKGEDWKTEETYVLQLRSSPFDYLITCGIGRELNRLLRLPITQSELDFAQQYYRDHANISFFNKEKWEWVIKDNGGVMPFKIDCLPEGTAVLPGDPILRVTGPGELAAHWEPNYHRIFYPTLVATEAHKISRLIGPKRFIEVGKRGAILEEAHLVAASAMYVGGALFLTSNDAAAATYPELRDTGTIGHRFVQFYVSEREAFEKAIEKLDAVSLLVDLNDTKQGIEIALELKKKYRDTGKKIWIRLDSGNITEQTLYALSRQKELGMIDPLRDKIVVEDLKETDDMVEIDRMVREAGFDPESFILYGAGELLVGKDKTRSFASSGLKLSQHHGEIDTMKRSDSPGKHSYPGLPTLEYIEGKRFVAQSGEYSQDGLFIPAYRPGRILLKETSLAAAHKQAAETFAQIEKAVSQKEHSIISPKTQSIISALEAKQRESIFVSDK